MAGDWIKMRTGLRRHPKVIAMSRRLAADREFMTWWSSTTRHGCEESVTEIVTFENVTRVTVCALLEVWGAINAADKGDGHVPYMQEIDIDDIAGMPGFGAAMMSVGWVRKPEGQDCQGLVFPNFSEFNTPDSRRGGAKSDAQRAREYRERKKAKELEEKERHERHERHGREEKRREESIKGPQAVPDTPSPENPGPPKRFKPPTLEEVTAYCAERGNAINPQKFLDHYEAAGWMRGKTKIRDWKACVRTWESDSESRSPSKAEDWSV